jgi:ribosomal protein S18 acetylase RimI-like enzyme
MRVSRLQASDVPRLLAARELYDHPPSPPAARAYLADERNVFFLAEEGERPVGFLRGTSLGQVHTERPQMFLYEIGVSAGYRRGGVGRALVKALLDHCRLHGFEEVFVFTDPANQAAVALYRGTGGVTETPADRMYVFRLDSPPAHDLGGAPHEERAPG